MTFFETVDCIHNTPGKLDLYGDPIKHRKKMQREKNEKRRHRERRTSRAEEARLNYIASKHPPATQSELDFRHAHWKEKRQLVRTALAKSGASLNALESFDNCGNDCVVYYSTKEERYRVSANTCHCRHCEPCQRAKGNLMAANLKKRLEGRTANQYKFLTLTLKHSDKPLRSQIQRLYNSFKKLRTLHVWKENVKGGVTILEVKWSNDTGEWHPHLHAIIEGDYMPQKWLADNWLEITGDSFKVDIKSLQKDKDAVHYLTKYVGKGSNADVWVNEHAANEWITSMRGVRTAGTFGTWRGFKLVEKPAADEGWERIDSMDNIYRKANAGDRQAIALIDVLRHTCQYNPHRPRGQKTRPPPPVAS